RQTVDAEAKFVSLGHWVSIPLQLSARSQAPVEARHATPIDANASGGHNAPFPGQRSAASQPPSTEGRQIVLEGRNALGGHWFETPLQLSPTSQMPAAGRQLVP